ncbi:hypothetical protein ABT317_28750 [Streptomyces carpinensis]|uniref:Uncharacterized protein n=1 Tax=Streptomyces carpinensis TaxID=66369 RepID=A0ABV1W9G9_9ACTN
MATAILGFSAPVEMVVAIALAVSWKPFVKSNASAVTTTIARISEKLSIYPGNRSSVIGWSNVGNQGEQKMNWVGLHGVRICFPVVPFRRGGCPRIAAFPCPGPPEGLPLARRAGGLTGSPHG